MLHPFQNTQTTTPTYVGKYEEIPKEEPNQAPISPQNSLDDSKREIFLLPRELEQYWPSILPVQMI